MLNGTKQKIRNFFKWSPKPIRHYWDGDHIPQRQYNKKNCEKIPGKQLRNIRIKICAALSISGLAIIFGFLGFISPTYLLVAWGLLLSLLIYNVLYNIIYKLMKGFITVCTSLKNYSLPSKLYLGLPLLAYETLLILSGVLLAYFVSPYIISALAGSVVMMVPALGYFLVYSSIFLASIKLFDMILFNSFKKVVGGATKSIYKRSMASINSVSKGYGSHHVMKPTLTHSTLSFPRNESLEMEEKEIDVKIASLEQSSSPYQEDIVGVGDIGQDNIELEEFGHDYHPEQDDFARSPRFELYRERGFFELSEGKRAPTMFESREQNTTLGGPEPSSSNEPSLVISEGIELNTTADEPEPSLSNELPSDSEPSSDSIIRT